MLAYRVAHRRILHEAQIGLDADRAQIADHRLGLRPLPVGVQVDLETVRVAGLGQQRFRLRRIIGVARRALVGTAELRRKADRVQHPRRFADHGLQHRLPVYGVIDRLAHAYVFQHGGGRFLVRGHGEEHDAHGLSRGHRERGHGFQLLRLVRRDVVNPIQPAGHQFGVLGVHVRDQAQLQRLDLRLRFGALLEVVRIALHAHQPPLLVLGHHVGSGTDRLLAHALGSDLGVVLVRVHHHRPGEVFQRRGKRFLHFDADLELIDLLGGRDPVDVLLRGRLVLRFGHEIELVHHVVGVEGLAVVEFHSAAQIEFERGVVYPAPGGRKRRLVFVGLRVAVDQRVPDVVRQDHADAHVVEISVQALRTLVGGEPDRVFALAGFDRQREGDCRGEQRRMKHGVIPGHGEVPRRLIVLA